MRSYTIYPLDQCGNVGCGLDFHLGEEADVLVVAHTFAADSPGAEVWYEGRLVGRVWAGALVTVQAPYPQAA